MSRPPCRPPSRPRPLRLWCGPGQRVDLAASPDGPCPLAPALRSILLIDFAGLQMLADDMLLDALIERIERAPQRGS